MSSVKEEKKIFRSLNRFSETAFLRCSRSEKQNKARFVLFFARLIVSESHAKEFGLWIPMEQVFLLGCPGPSGNENDTYAFESITYKVNNLLNSQGSVLKLFYKILLHNIIFTETYS